MASLLDSEVLNDDLAVSLARSLAAANRRAHECGVEADDSLITISQIAGDAGALWRVNYGPRDYINQRGGDLIVEVNPADASILRVIRGQ
jgi:hypothetical protein